MDKISVVTPTFNRPEPLLRALKSLMLQEDLVDLEPEIIVVDNSVDANARAAVEAIGQNAPFPVRYVSEPRPGVANARNAGVSSAQGRWVAFLDDDEEADRKWLANLTLIARKQNADAVFGPISARAEGGADIGPFAPYFERRIARADGAEITDLAAYLGTNNSLFARESCFDRPQNFDPSLNESGGEDSLLLQYLVMSGKRFYFASEAQVIEWAPPRRLNWAYVKKRKFLSGQIRVFVQDMARSNNAVVVMAWMFAGLAQAAVFGFLALLMAPFSGTKYQKLMARAFGGLGKLFWSKRFRLSLYGRALVS